MVVKALAPKLKLADSVAPNPAGSTEMRLQVCAWSAASPAQSWHCLSRRASNSASCAASNQGVQNRTEWPRCFQNCTPENDTYALKNYGPLEQIRVHRHLWGPSTKLGGWGYGGGMVGVNYSGNHKPYPCAWFTSPTNSGQAANHPHSA